MDSIPMNEKTGRMLHALCVSLLNEGPVPLDMAAVAQGAGMDIETLERYCKGTQDMLPEHLIRMAEKCCSGDAAALKAVFAAAYTKGEEEKREKAIEKAAEVERLRLCEEEWRKEAEENRRLEALKRHILTDLHEYGIKSIYTESEEYPLDDYYPLKFIIHYLNDKEYLPKLEALLRTFGDEALVYKDSNALMWSGYVLAFEKLKLLENRKNFIAAHINDCGPKGKTALHYAAEGWYDDPDALKLLAGWGADVNAKDDALWTALHVIASRNQDNRGSWKVLTELGAENSEDTLGQTPGSIQFRLDALDAW